MGRLDGPLTRWLMAALVARGAGVLRSVGAVLAGDRRRRAADRLCAPTVPANALQIGSAPTVVEVAGKAETYVALAVTLATLVVYAMRLARASRPAASRADGGRRHLAAVPARVLRLQLLRVDPEARPGHARARWRGASWRRACCCRSGSSSRCCRRTGSPPRRCGRCSSGSPLVPRPEQWRDTIATALDDPALRLGYRDPDDGPLPRARRGELSPPAADTGRVWLPIDRDDAAGRGDGRRRDARRGSGARARGGDGDARRDRERRARGRAARVARAAARGRARPSANASSASCTTARSSGCWRCASTSRSRARSSSTVRTGRCSQRLDDEVELAIQELRGVAHGSVPPILRAHGLGPALAGGRAALPDAGPGRDRRAGAPARGARVRDLLLLPGRSAERGQARRPRRVGRRCSSRSATAAWSSASTTTASASIRRPSSAAPGLTNLADRVGASVGRCGSTPLPAVERASSATCRCSLSRSGRQTSVPPLLHHPARVMRAPAGQRHGGSDPPCSRRPPHPRRPKA